MKDQESVKEAKNPSTVTFESPRPALERWILRETLASTKQKRPIYFWKMAAIGPCATANLNNAAKFGSKQEAMMSPAYVHPLSFYEPERDAETPKVG